MKNLFSFIFTVLITAAGISQENMTFQAKITNRNGETLSIRNNQNFIQEIKSDSEGNFKATFVVTEGTYQLFDGVEHTLLFLKNGFDLKMTVDGKDFDQSIKFEGKGSKENNFLAQESLAEQKFGYTNMLAADEETFKKILAEKIKADTERIDKAGLDPNFVATHKKDVAMGMMQLQQYYAQISANRKLNNTKAPDFDYENHKGGKTTLASLKGKYVYIDVWATWCGPCRGEIPFLKTIESKYHGKNIEFVSISIDEAKDHDKWKNFVTEKQLEGIQLMADKNWGSSFVTAFGIQGIPRFILIDPNGIVLDADAKRPSNPELQAQLDALLK